MRISKYLFVLTTFVTYTLLGFFSFFRIKLAPLAETTGMDDGTNYFLENFMHNWDVKLIMAIGIAIVINMFAHRKGKAED